MHKAVSGILGLAVAGLAAAYVLRKDKNQRLGQLDTEKSITVARIPIATSLIWAAIAGTPKTAKRALSSVGVSYIGMALGSIFDRKLGGTLQKGFSKSDTIFHLVSGLGALAVSLVPEGEKKQPVRIPVSSR
jgi:hypothetical protein